MWFNGLLDLSVMQLILVVLGMTHITIISVTLYLHRHSAHNSLDVVDHSAEYQRMDLDPPQASRQMRDGRRSSQPGGARNKESAV